MLKRLRIPLLLALTFCLGFKPLEAQKKITPVDNDPTKPAQPILHFYDKHGDPLDEPVLFLADLDTVKAVKPGPVYPLWKSVSIGFNFFDGIMMMAGQKYANFDIQAELSLHNWIQPVVELGMGFADSKPEEGNYHYKSKPSIYGKLGANYNFLYQSDPDYQLHIGLRAGYTHFSYDITDVTINSSYWGQSQNFSILNQKSHAFYGELLGGIKVTLWKNIAMGWDFRYKFMMKLKNGSNSKPWFIPGYGTSSPINASFSLIYTIPINKGRKKAVLPDDVKGNTDDIPAIESSSDETDPQSGAEQEEIEPVEKEEK